ncbi:glycosyltransferase [Roseimaritima ulvae]|nr:glycosyltransferase [Roseimaritima ulvae]
MLRELAQRHRVTLACTTDEAVADSDLQHVEELCESVLVAPLHRLRRVLRGAGSVARGGSLTEGMFHSPALFAQVASAQQQHPFDNVLVFCSSMFPYIDHGCFTGTPTVVDLVDVDSQKWAQMSRETGAPKRWVYRLEAHRVGKLEQRIANRACAVTLVSDSEADVFRKTLTEAKPALNICGISNGVDTDYFRPPSGRSHARQSVGAGVQPLGAHKPITESAKAYTPAPSQANAHQSVGPQNEPPSGDGSYGGASAETDPSNFELRTSNFLRLVFTGVLDYHPNVEGIDWFCRQVMPELLRNVDAELAIVGRRPTPRVLELANMAGVRVVGEVPDVRPYLHAADVAISPLSLARGIQNKVLEAMATGLPVVLTRPSAEGIEAESGQHFVIADSAAEWTERLVALARDAQSRADIGEAARELVVKEYSWSAKLSDFQTLLDTNKTDAPHTP